MMPERDLNARSAAAEAGGAERTRAEDALPARAHRAVQRLPQLPSPAGPSTGAGGRDRAELRRLRLVQDPRGDLSAGEVGRELPFVVRRYFLIFGVPSDELRGEHAHHRCAQFLVAVRGNLWVAADDGQHKQQWHLDRPDYGVYLPPLVWGAQYRYSADAVLMVLASDPYDPDDYIREYAQFLALATSARAPAERAG